MLYHRQQVRYCQPLSSQRIILRIRVRRFSLPIGFEENKKTSGAIRKKYGRQDSGNFSAAEIKGQRHWVAVREKDGVKRFPMYPYAFTPHYIYFQGEAETLTLWKIRYYFQMEAGEAGTLYLFPQGVFQNAENKVNFVESVALPSFLPEDIFTETFSYQWTEKDIHAIPAWLYEAVFYQIFPDRFYNGNPANDPPGTLPWGEKPTTDNFFGGDLEGLIEKIPYLRQLGVNAIYLNPIFSAPSNHKYNTIDYFIIDPSFGNRTVMRKLVGSLRGHGIRLILDGVFNHTGTGFWAFQDVLANGEASAYKDWYYFDGFPVCMAPNPNYQCWWNIASLPKLRATNPETRQYLLSVGAHWLKEEGINGWRLDVPNEIEPSFWEEFRRQMKEVNPQAYLVGEIWRDARFWLGKYFDGVMNYYFRDLVLDCFAGKLFPLSTLDFLLGLVRLRYPEANNFALLNLLDSHDTARVMTEFRERLAKNNDRPLGKVELGNRLRPALILQMTYPGIPMIYYGDEVGMTGGKDPDCRKTMVWDPEKQNKKLLAFYRQLISLRHHLPALQRGYFIPLLVDDEREIYIYARRFPEQPVIVVINAGNVTRSVTAPAELFSRPEGEAWRDGLSQKIVSVREGEIRMDKVEPYYGAILYPFYEPAPPVSVLSGGRGC